MESNWASENLQVIRTLMERSALYRRALAPVMIFAGCVGTLAGAVGIWEGIDSAQGFTRLWILAGLIAAAGVFVLIRRQALKDVEPVWSSPTRRVVQAIIPPLFVGLAAAIPFFLKNHQPDLIWWLVPGWLSLYGCALCAAGSFMPRGIKIFGWLFILGGCGLFIYLTGPFKEMPPLKQAHLLMGSTFGLIHLLYGGYLYVTEQKRKNAA